MIYRFKVNYYDDFYDNDITEDGLVAADDMRSAYTELVDMYSPSEHQEIFSLEVVLVNSLNNVMIFEDKEAMRKVIDDNEI